VGDGLPKEEALPKQEALPKEDRLPKEEALQHRPSWDNCEEGCSQSEEKCDSSRVASGGEGDSRTIPRQESKVARRLVSKKTKGSGLKKTSRKEKKLVGTDEVVGCLKCHRDTNYKQVC